MARYYIESIRCDEVTGGMACGPCCGPEVVEAEVKTDGGETFFMAIAIVAGMPHIYASGDSIYDVLACNTDNEDDAAIIDSCLEFGGTYEELFEEEGHEDYPLYMYLLYIAEAYREEKTRYISETTGKWLDEIEIPRTEIEMELMEGYETEEIEIIEDEIDDVEAMYRARLMLEANVNTESVFHDLNPDALEGEKNQLQVLQKDCGEDYQRWKIDYIKEQREKLKEEKFLVCPYVFAGIGQYDAVITEKELSSFECWIKGNGSAVMGEPRAANEEEIEIYIAMHAME